MFGRDRSPWVSMWFAPKQTMNLLQKKGMHRSFIILSFLWGWVFSLQLAAMGDFFLSMGTLQMAFWVVVFAPLLGGLFFSLVSLVFWGIGKCFKGKATFSSMLMAVSWSYITNIATLGLWLILFLFFQEYAFGSASFLLIPIGATRLFLQLLVIGQNICAIWALVLLVIAVATVQKFSILKAIVNFVLVCLFFFLAMQGITKLIN